VAKSSPSGARGIGFFTAAAMPVWTRKIIRNEQGAAKPIICNAIVALSEDPLFVSGAGQHAICYDAFRNQAMVCASVPWDLNGVIPRPWRDQDDREVAVWLQDNMVTVSLAIARDAVQTVAERNRYHPVMDFLAAVRWDGTPRLDTWLPTYLGAKNDIYTRAVGPRWMISAVARIFRPGCKADCVLILEGPQGIYKSTTFEVLGGAWYTNDVAALGTKDAQEQIVGIWIVEFDELDAVTRASDISRVKAFVSRGTDRFRFSYGHRVEQHPRQCVFGATSNKDTWQRDETGARRWWPVRCGTIDIDRLRDDRDQLWAEARDRYLANERWWLEERELIEAAKVEQEKRFEQDPWEEIIVERLDGLTETSMNSLLNALGLPTERRSPAETKRIAAIMRRLNWQRKQVGTAPYRSWKYVPKV
jgi:putative DNA primase/helicase